MSRTSRQQQPSRFAAFLRGTASAAVLAAVVVGTPWSLVTLAGSPFPDRLPTWDETSSALSRRDDGSLLLGFLTYLCWGVWLVFTALLVIEVAAQLRGRSAPRIPGLDGPQRMAALLIAGLGATLIGTSVSMTRASAVLTPPQSMAVSTAPPHTAYVEGTPAVLAERQDQVAEFDGGSDALGNHGSKIVASGRNTGSPAQKKINVGFGFDSATLSPAALDALTAAAQDIREHADQGQPIVIVGHTDSLGPTSYNQQLSVRRARAVREALGYLAGHGHRFQVSGRGETQPVAREPGPGGADEPAARARNRRVEITYTLALRTTPRAPAPPRPSPGADNGGQAAAAPPTSPAASSTPSSPVPSRPTAPSTAFGGSPPSYDQPAPTQPSTTIDLPSGAVVGLSFAAGVGTALTATRLHRRRRHRTPESGPDLAKREPRLVPTIRKLRRADLAARQSGLADPAQGHHELSDLHMFPLSSSGRIVLGTRGDEEIAVPIGGLVVGLTGSGAQAAARALLLALLLHAGDHDVEVIVPRSDAIQLLRLGPEELDQTTTYVQALRVVADLDAAVRLVDAELVHRARLLDATDSQDMAAVREADPTEPLPSLVFAATPDVENQRRLETLSAQAADYDIAVVLLGDNPAGMTLTVEDDGRAHATGTSDSHPWQGLRLFHVSQDDTREVLELIQSALGAPEPEPTANQQSPASAPEPLSPTSTLTHDENAKTRPAYLRVFGPPALMVEGRELATGLRGTARELLVFLAIHSRGATRDAILEALWPEVDQKHAVMRFHSALNDVRRELRRATGLINGGFIDNVGERYRIDPELVAVDLWRFQTALHQAAQTDDDQIRGGLLRRAADTYGDRLAAENSYEWIEPEREALHRQAVETFTHLADLLDERNPEQALAALERAISLDRHAEEAYQRIMTIQGRLGRLDAVRRTHRLLQSNLEDLGVDPSDETEQLLWRLLRAQRHTRSRPPG